MEITPLTYLVPCSDAKYMPNCISRRTDSNGHNGVHIETGISCPFLSFTTVGKISRCNVYMSPVWSLPADIVQDISSTFVVNAIDNG